VVGAIDARYRTRPERRCRGIGGASLGAISALQLGLVHARRFGLVLALSPVLAEPALARSVAAAWARARTIRPSSFLLDFDDGPSGAVDRAWFQALLGRASDALRETILLQTPGGRHAIASWAARVLPALTLLLPARCPG
jgi:enterochelin esterase-like enzyme